MTQPPPYEVNVEELMRRLEGAQQSIEASMRAAAAASATVSSPDRAVTVTVNQFGDLTDLTFGGTRYRSLAPAELGRVIVETLAQARDEVRDQLAGAYGGTLPGGADMRELMSGDFDVARVMRDLVTERTAAHAEMYRMLWGDES